MALKEIGKLLFAIQVLLVMTLFPHLAAASPLQQADVGYGHTLLLRDDGSLRAWGENGQGQLGDGTTESSKFPVTISDLSNVISVAAGHVHSVALRSDGTVWVWGDNSRGQLAQPDSVVSSSYPIQVEALSNVVAIVAGYYHTLALTAGGRVWAWGGNDAGQLGDGSRDDRYTPAQVILPMPTSEIAVGGSHSYALLVDGSAWTWGANLHFSLSYGPIVVTPKPISAWDHKFAKSAQTIEIPGYGGGAVAISGLENLLVIQDDGTILSSAKLDGSGANSQSKAGLTEVLWSGALSVEILPAEAVRSGVQWRLSGGDWQTSGSVIAGLPEGNYTIEYRDSYKWNAPPSEDISIVEGRMSSITTVSQRKLGSLSVSLVPAEAVAAGVQWRLRGGDWLDSGVTINDLPVDNYVVEFSKVVGWEQPEPQAVALKEHGAVVDVSFGIKYANLQVNIEPAEAAQMGAKWRILDDYWNASGDVVSDLQVGEYVVEFAQIPGYEPPRLQRVDVGEKGAVISAQYRSLAGSVGVSLSPAEVLGMGATWRIDGGPWQPSETVISGVSAGTHNIEFATVEGWYTPPSQVVWVDDGRLSVAAGNYAMMTGDLTVNINPADAIGEGAMWRLQGGAWQQSGDVLYELPIGSYTIEFADVLGWDTPAAMPVVMGDRLSEINVEYSKALSSAITVNIQPAAAVYAGAQWRIYGDSWQQSGSQVSALSSGLYTIEFSTIANWQSPAVYTVNLDPDESYVLNVVYDVDSTSIPQPLGDNGLLVGEMEGALMVLADGGYTGGELQAGESQVYAFEAMAGRTYLMLLEGDYPGCISIYSADGTTLLANSHLTVGSGFGRVEWQAPTSGQYFAKVEYYDQSVSGYHNLAILLKGVNGDFNNDGYSDILLRDPQSGDIAMRYIEGSTLIGDGMPLIQPGSLDESRLLAFADFNADGSADLLWQNAEGLLSVWLMDGLELKAGSGFTTQTMADMANKEVVAAADFNGDGRADILWRDTRSGRLTVWLMSGRQVLSASGELSQQPRMNSPWQLAGVGDFNGDNNADILWRSEANGYTTVWFLDGTEVLSDESAQHGSGMTSIQEPLDSAWHIQAVDDFNGDGYADVLWHDAESEIIRLWYMKGREAYAPHPYLNLGYGWQFMGYGDYNGDGKTDLLMQDSLDESLHIMLMGEMDTLPMSELLQGTPSVGQGWTIIAN